MICYEPSEIGLANSPSSWGCTLAIGDISESEPWAGKCMGIPTPWRPVPEFYDEGPSCDWLIPATLVTTFLNPPSSYTGTVSFSLFSSGFVGLFVVSNGVAVDVTIELSSVLWRDTFSDVSGGTDDELPWTGYGPSPSLLLEVYSFACASSPLSADFSTLP